MKKPILENISLLKEPNKKMRTELLTYGCRVHRDEDEDEDAKSKKKVAIILCSGTTHGLTGSVSLYSTPQHLPAIEANKQRLFEYRKTEEKHAAQPFDSSRDMEAKALRVPETCILFFDSHQLS